MRFVIVGAGAIGGTLAGFLIRGGETVILVARVGQLQDLAVDGLTIDSHDDGCLNVPPSAIVSLSQVCPTTGDVLLLCVKGFDTETTIQELAAHLPLSTPIFCFQNGVRNEDMAAVCFHQVHGGFVNVSATCLAVGRIQHTGGRLLGVGLWPAGLDDVDQEVAGRLEGAGFTVGRHPDIRAVKWGKCLINSNNAVLALTGQSLPEALADGATRLLMADVLAEGVAAARAAGLEPKTGRMRRSLDEMIQVLRSEDGRTAFKEEEKVASSGPTRPSTWQDLLMKRGKTEVDAFNGEVVRLGRGHDADTPINTWLLEEIQRRARAGEAPGGMTAAGIRSAIASTAGVRDER